VNGKMLKFVDVCGVIAELSALDFDSQTHERHLVFEALLLSYRNALQ